MPSWNKRLLALGLLLLIFDGIWTFHLSPALLHSMHMQGDLVYETDGNTLETFPGPQVYSRFIEIHSMSLGEAEGGLASMEFKSVVTKLPSNDLSWSQVNSVRFDPATLKVAGGDAFIVFPRHVAPQDHRVKFFSYVPDSGTLFRFRGVDEVRGLRSYVFEFVVEDLDWTENYSLALPADVRIKSRDWGTVWIEPSTGILVNHKEQWVAKAEGGAFSGIEVDSGSMWLSNDTIVKQVFLAQNMRRAAVLYETILPPSMLGVAAVLIAVAAARRRKAMPE